MSTQRQEETAPEPEVQTPPQPQVQETPIPKNEPAQASREFLNYHTSTVAPMSDSAIIEREYRNILGDFVNSSFETRFSRAAETESVQPPAQEQPQSVVTSESTPNVDTEATRKWSKLTGDVREMGDNVIIRTHDHKSSKEYNNTYLYYANKLGLVHYGILFGLCILAVVFTVIFVHPIMGAGRNSDKWFYLVATLLTVALPITAFAKYSRNPNKRKRINYGLKFSLICRIVIMIQCLVIVYLINVMVGMPASFDKEYLSTLLLPALFCLMIPISTLIFNALFKSRRFAVE
ncbi:MAG: hypothetical protein K2M95_08165 [Clostridiales bacterium]|nr:hypothetical protein [Clostridiales bacterium]